MSRHQNHRASTSSQVRTDQQRVMSPSSGSVLACAAETFDHFIGANTLKGVILNYRKMCHMLDLNPGAFNQFYPAFKRGITGGSNKINKNWKAQSIFSKIEKKANSRIYHSSGASASGSSSAASGSRVSSSGYAAGHHHQGSLGSNNILEDHNCLIVGGGPCGLRSAIELQLLGARHVVVIEKRDRLSRNNVLHLWPFVITDLKNLAGKKFYGKFCAGIPLLSLY